MGEELEHCELGTQEYWDNRYKEEIKSYNSHGDVGEIWFGEDIVDRLIKWMNSTNLDKNNKILDIGCGNGMLLVELYNEGFRNLVGADYSENAITLARSICLKYQCNIEFMTCNVLNRCESLDEFDIILDKGTYDAISLSYNAKTNRATYIKNIHSFLKPTGCLILTSCNWTKDELMEQFKNYFELQYVIPTPEFKFGGKVGSVVTIVVFKWKHLEI